MKINKTINTKKLELLAVVGNRVEVLQTLVRKDKKEISQKEIDNLNSKENRGKWCYA